MEKTTRLAMYRNKELIDYLDVDLDDSIENVVRDFVDWVNDEHADYVRVSLYSEEGRRENGWNTPVDTLFEQFMEQVIEDLIEERFMCEVERNGRSED